MRSFRIGSAFGIPIKLDLTFLLVLPLFAYLIGSQSSQIVELLNQVLGATITLETFDGGATRWVLGTVAALGLFVGVLLHELGHSLVARRFGFPIDSITLWIFGGIASFTEMPEDWRQELAIAIAGPVVSVLVGVVCFGLFSAVPASAGGAQFVFGYLAVLNVILAVFNLLPAFPMDGGRILRAILARTRPYARATSIAAEVGKFFAVLLGLLGLFSFNVLMIGIAFFVYIAASSESQQVQLKAAFEGVTVRDVMTPSERLHTVSPDTTIAELLQRMFRERHTGYPVIEDGQPVGMVTLDDAREVTPVEREAFTVDDVMSRDLVTIPVDADAMAAFDRLQEHDVGRLLVVDTRGDIVGLLSRTDLMTALDVVRSTDTIDGGDLRSASN
ncbi:Zn-dependent protease (includes SpoIVFB) [Natronoarchaeum philippinense]|uniref:Zinc metalloprotease n=1 Tax=Natronoarchaeum philippinense TaxID=558529 RepID=A0A285P6K9_NATPI|nr:site-2 protease family protein [Natronoarchaeum philippinense]SNZ17375.1 Zn-dependent protease (includes SpoIVFB) [Natronoarchaeum philippinense]